MGRSREIIEVTFVILAIISFVVGGVKLFVGVGHRSILSFLDNMEGVHYIVTGTSLILIGMGVILMVISWCGCCGFDHFWALITCAILLLTIWIIQTYWIITISSQFGENAIKKNLYESLHKLYQNDGKNSKATIDYIHTELKCCGIRGPTNEATLPQSCCRSYLEDICVPFKEGCWPKLYHLISDSIRTMEIVLGVFAAFELIVAGLAVYIDPESTAEINRDRERKLSVATVKRRLLERNLHDRIATCKPRRENRQKHLQWARVHRNWTIEDGIKVLWADESKFKLFEQKL